MIEKLGKYNIVGELGQGAMGTVYKGEDPVIGRTVAIKTINAAALAGQNAVEAATRFKQEAQAAGRLNHPNIVVVYDYGEEAGSAFIAMGFVEGRELKICFDNHEVFALEDIVHIMDQLLDALNFAHANKIVHRDIKPGNIIINDKGHIMITDFGIARLENSDLTQVGATMGTPNYMAPEQCMGQRIDGRADIFSAAVILYQLLTGEKPFAGPNIASIMHKILKVDPVPPSELNMQLSPAFDTVIAKGLAKKPDDRFATADDFRKALQAAARGETSVVQDETIVVGAGAVAPPEVADDATVIAPAGLAEPDTDDGTVFAAVAPDASGATEPEDGTIALDSLGGMAPPAVSAPLPASSGDDVQDSPAKKKKPLPLILAGVGLVVAVAVGGMLFLGGGAEDDTGNGGSAPIADVSVQPSTTTAVPPPVSSPVVTSEPVYAPPSAAGLFLETIPPQARVMVDGVETPGFTPVSIDLSAGEHDIVVLKDGYYAVPVSVDVGAGDMVPMAITLFRK